MVNSNHYYHLQNLLAEEHPAIST